MAGLKDIAKKIRVRPEIVEDVFDAIIHEVKKGRTVRIQGFGTFFKKTHLGRRMESPVVNGGEPIEFPDSEVLKFRQSKNAKKFLNAPKKTRATAKKKKG